MKEQISIKMVAQKMHKDPSWVRMGIIKGWLPIGIATRNGDKVLTSDAPNSKKGRISYYIFPEKFSELILEKGRDIYE